MTDTTDRLKGLASKAKEKEIANILRKLNDGKTLTATEQKRLDDWTDTQSTEQSQHPLDPEAVVRTAALVELFGVSAVTIASLAKDGTIKRKKTGVYYALASIKGFIEHLRKNRKTKHGDGGETNQELRDMLIREQARKERAIASLRELELEMKEKSLMPESTIAETIAKICTPLRRLLDALPRAAAATANPGKPMLAERAIRNALDERIFGELEKIMKDLDITPPEKQ